MRIDKTGRKRVGLAFAFVFLGAASAFANGVMGPELMLEKGDFQTSTLLKASPLAEEILNEGNLKPQRDFERDDLFSIDARLQELRAVEVCA